MALRVRSRGFAPIGRIVPSGVYVVGGCTVSGVVIIDEMRQEVLEEARKLVTPLPETPYMEPVIEGRLYPYMVSLVKGTSFPHEPWTQIIEDPKWARFWLKYLPIITLLGVMGTLGSIIGMVLTHNPIFVAPIIICLVATMMGPIGSSIEADEWRREIQQYEEYQKEQQVKLDKQCVKQIEKWEVMAKEYHQEKGDYDGNYDNGCGSLWEDDTVRDNQEEI